MSALKEYTDIKIICDAVEKAAINRARRGHRTSGKVAALNSLLSTDQLLHSTTMAVDAMRKKPVSNASRPTSEERTRRESRDTQSEKKSQNKKSAASAYASYEAPDRWNVCPPDYPGDEWEAEAYTPKASFGFAANPFDAANADTDKAIRDLLGLDPNEDLAEGFENCLGCDLRVQFDFQLQPINLLFEFDGLLDQIQDIIDFWKQYANPLNFLERICEFLDFWNANFNLCKQDLIALLLALQALLAKYANLAISITFDWTILFGPLLKFILDALAQLIEQVIQLLTAPIDCIIGVLKTIDELISAVVDTANVAAAFGETMAGMGGDTPLGGTSDDGFLNLGGLGNYKAEGTKAEAAWEGGPGSGGINIGGEEQGFIPKMEPSDNSFFSVGDTQPPGLEVGKTAFGEKLNNEKGDSKVEFPLGFNLAGKNGLEEALLDPRFKYSSPLQKIILALQEARLWITKLFANILFSLKSLSALVGGGISINLKNIGFLMMILDIINLIKMLASLQGVNPCSDNINDIANFIKRYYQGAEVEIDGNTILVSQGDYTQEIVLVEDTSKPCQSVHSVTDIRDTSQQTYQEKQSKKDN